MRLILLPGLDGTGDLFSTFLSELPEDINFTVISYPEVERLSYSELVDYVQARLPKNEDFMVLAESFSGPLAFQLAQLELKHLQAIIFVASFIRNPDRLLLWLMRLLPLSLLLRISPPDYMLRKWLFGNEAERDTLNKFKSVVRRLPVKTIIFRLHQIRSLGRVSGSIQFPVYYIRAMNDHLVGEANVQDFVLRCSPLDIVIINGPHFILQSKPKECARYVVRFVRQQSSRS